jgi:hypothetical protein
MNNNPRVGDPLGVTKQFYQINAWLGKPNPSQRQDHLNHGIPIWKDKSVRVAHMGKLLGWREANVHVEGNLSQPLEQPGKYHELLLNVGIAGSMDAVEQPHQVGLATGKAEVAVAYIETLRYGHDRCRGHSLPFTEMAYREKPAGVILLMLVVAA